MTADVDERIKHVIDMVFLPGFNSPTIAVLFQNTQTWTRYVLPPKRTLAHADSSHLVVFGSTRIL